MSTYRNAHKGDPARIAYWLVNIQFPSPAYLTEADFNISYGGNTYTPAYDVRLDMIGASEQEPAEADIRIGNGDAAFGAVIQGLSGSQRSPAITIYQAWFDLPTFIPPGVGAAATPTAVDTQVVGRMETPQWDSTYAKFHVGPSVDSRAQKLPAGAFSTTCRYRVYKGPECQATSGLTTCNRSFTDCTARSNTVHFGGFRFIPKPGLTVAFEKSHWVVKVAAT